MWRLNLNNISIDLNFEAFTKGFLEGTANSLTEIISELLQYE